MERREAGSGVTWINWLGTIIIIAIFVVIAIPFALLFGTFATCQEMFRKRMRRLATSLSSEEDLQLLKALRRSANLWNNYRGYLGHSPDFDREEFLAQMPQSRLGIPRGFGGTYAERLADAREEAAKKAKKAITRQADLQAAIQQCLLAGISPWRINQFLWPYTKYKKAVRT